MRQSMPRNALELSRGAGFALAPSLANYFPKRNRRRYSAPMGAVACSDGLGRSLTALPPCMMDLASNLIGSFPPSLAVSGRIVT